MSFNFPQKVLFKHCDPAGIVFYPRYFEMINDCIEAFFDTALNWPFEQLLKTGGVPTVSIATEFEAPSRHGDQLLFSLTVTAVGRSSLDLLINSHCMSEHRLAARSTLVKVDDRGRAEDWPDEMQSRLQDLMDTPE